MFIAATPLHNRPKPRRGGTACMVPPRCRPSGAWAVLLKVVCYKYGAPTELALRCGLSGEFRFAATGLCESLAVSGDSRSPLRVDSTELDLRAPRDTLFAHDGLKALLQAGDQLFMGGVGFRVGQGAFRASVSEGVGYAFPAGGDVLAVEDVEQLE